MNSFYSEKILEERNLTDFFADAIIVLDKKKLNLRFVNHEAEIILGCSKKNAVKKNINFFFNKTSVVFDSIQSSLKHFGTFFFYDINP